MIADFCIAQLRTRDISESGFNTNDKMLFGKSSETPKSLNDKKMLTCMI